MTTYKQLVADHEEYREGQIANAVERSQREETRLSLADAYVIWSRKRGAWWRPNGAGYTEQLAHAGVYTEEAARDIERQSQYGPSHLHSEAIALHTIPHEHLSIRPGTVLWLLTQGTV